MLGKLCLKPFFKSLQHWYTGTRSINWLVSCDQSVIFMIINIAIVMPIHLNIIIVLHLLPFSCFVITCLKCLRIAINYLNWLPSRLITVELFLLGSFPASLCFLNISLRILAVSRLVDVVAQYYRIISGSGLEWGPRGRQIWIIYLRETFICSLLAFGRWWSFGDVMDDALTLVGEILFDSVCLLIYCRFVIGFCAFWDGHFETIVWDSAIKFGFFTCKDRNLRRKLMWWSCLPLKNGVVWWHMILARH